MAERRNRYRQVHRLRTDHGRLACRSYFTYYYIKKSGRITVCSIFVNPTQFNDPKDFQKYPITLEKDIALLEAAGADVLFLPGVTELYPGGTANLEHYDLGPLETVLEGKYRPGHFQGVCQVCTGC